MWLKIGSLSLFGKIGFFVEKKHANCGGLMLYSLLPIGQAVYSGPY